MFTSNGYNAFSAGFGDFLAIDQIQTWWFAICVCEGLGEIYYLQVACGTNDCQVACAVQSFYAWRIYIISGKKRITTGLIMLVNIIHA